jgi:hypothetical protein
MNNLHELAVSVKRTFNSYERPHWEKRCGCQKRAARHQMLQERIYRIRARRLRDWSDGFIDNQEALRHG